MNAVHINGISLIPGIDYSVTNRTISFARPPDKGDEILFTEVIDVKSGATHVTRLFGDGRKFVFALETNFADRLKLNTLFEDAMAHKDNAAVRDILEQLQVVIELVKQDDFVR